MEEPRQTNERIDRELTGETVSTSHYDVTPVARLQGRWGISQGDKNQSGYAWFRLKPVKISVRDASGHTEEIELTDINAQAATVMGMIALGIAAACVLISLVRKLFQ